MKLDDFLRVKQARCVAKDNHLHLTYGRAYDVIGVSHERIKVHNDKGHNSWYDMDCFELVPNSAETPPRVAKPRFSVGEKVYFSTDPDIKTISEVGNDNDVQFAGEFGWASGYSCCPATQENYEKLCSLFECIDFEQPPTQADIDNETVDKLAKAMKDKLAKKREQGYHGWETCKHGDLVQLLINHVDKGDPVDVANFCAFLFARGEKLTHGGT